MAASPKPSLSAGDLAAIDGQLAATDRLLEQNYPGDDGSRQPVHTVYVPADRFTPSFAADWGAEALATANAHGGVEKLGAQPVALAVGESRNRVSGRRCGVFIPAHYPAHAGAGGLDADHRGHGW